MAPGFDPGKNKGNTKLALGLVPTLTFDENCLLHSLTKYLGILAPINACLSRLISVCVFLLTGFIQNLIGKGHNLDAIKYIFSLDMVDIFRPIPLLEAYLQSTKNREINMEVHYV